MSRARWQPHRAITAALVAAYMYTSVHANQQRFFAWLPLWRTGQHDRRIVPRLPLLPHLRSANFADALDFEQRYN
eukprot:7919333-Lingulodinium_polyedra.AAC.1